MAAMKKSLVLRIRVSEEEFVISESGAALSATLQKMIVDGVADDGVINLSNIVRRSTVPMIIDYLETHAAAAGLSYQEKWDFDSEFASGKDTDFLQYLLLDAFALEIEGLKALVARKLADIIKVELADRVPIPAERIKRPLRVPTEEDKEGFIRKYPSVDRAALEERCRQIQEQERLWQEEQVELAKIREQRWLEERMEQAKIQ